MRNRFRILPRQKQHAPKVVARYPIRRILLQHDLQLLRRLRAQRVPVVAVFLSGRPLWVNAELNASDSFVAAWLPGAEGAGVADVLFSAADGSVGHDFRGKLSFSWPRSLQPPALGGRPGEPPLFSFGYGLTFRDNGDLPQLPEH